MIPKIQIKTVKLFMFQNQVENIKKSRRPDLNQRSVDLQSTALTRLGHAGLHENK